MKILATADLHGHLPEVPPCDLLLIAGDICPDFLVTQYGHSVKLIDKGEQRQRHWLDTTFREWLEDIPAERVVGIAGNHDFVFEKPWLIPDDLRWAYLRDEFITVPMVEHGLLDGLLIYGSPWVPNLPTWAFHARDEALQLAAEAVPEGIDILLWHGPPRGYGDEVEPHGSVGDKFIEPELHRIAAKTMICGHIHEGFGVYEHVSGTRIYNVALNDERYNPVNPIVEVRLPALDTQQRA